MQIYPPACDEACLTFLPRSSLICLSYGRLPGLPHVLSCVSAVLSGGFSRGKTPTLTRRTGSFLVDTGTGNTASCQTFTNGHFPPDRGDILHRTVSSVRLPNSSSNYKQYANGVL